MPDTTTTPALAGLYLAEVPVTDLAPGDVVISVGRALHLVALTGHLLGYDRWSYTVVLGPEDVKDGQPATREGVTNFRRDGHANVVRQAAV